MGHIFFVVFALVLIAVFLESLNFAFSTNRIMIPGIFVFSIWCLKYSRNKNIATSFQEYWNDEVEKT